MKLPILTSFVGAVLIFIGSAAVAFNAVEKLAYRHRKPMVFASLGKEGAEDLRRTARALVGLQLSTTSLGNTEISVQKNLSDMVKLRGTSPAEVVPLFDLRIAKSYAMMARLDEQRGDGTKAAEHRQEAAKILQSLGWQDVSDTAMTALANRELGARLKR